MFQERYNAKLGFMSFFVKAVIESLKACPELNAEIRDNSIVYRNFYDISIAVGGGKGLVVPVIRNAELLSFAEIEQTIADFAARAKSGQLKPDELIGGTFTITNGGVFGSMLSTPIVNPPQSGILGLHAIQDRAGRPQRPGGHPADDVRGVDLRPPHRRRPRGGGLSCADQGVYRGADAAAVASLDRPQLTSHPAAATLLSLPFIQ